MTDRELMELAAKAAGINMTDPDEKYCSPDWDHDWNPITDDGDALRLAVQLRITIDRAEAIDAAYCYCDWRDTANIAVVQQNGADHYAATRLAIVRAAAEIGKGMP